MQSRKQDCVLVGAEVAGVVVAGVVDAGWLDAGAVEWLAGVVLAGAEDVAAGVLLGLALAGVVAARDGWVPLAVIDGVAPPGRPCPLPVAVGTAGTAGAAGPVGWPLPEGASAITAPAARSTQASAVVAGHHQRHVARCESGRVGLGAASPAASRAVPVRRRRPSVPSRRVSGNA